MKIKALLVLIYIIVGQASLAQVPSPGEQQARPILLVNGTLHTGTGQAIEKSVVGFDKGIITVVGTASQQVDNKGNYEVIDVSGKHIYPGFILPSTDLGLNEVAAVRATQDKAEAGSIKPNVRAAIAYNTDSEIIPTLRFNGILTAQVAPKGGIIPGVSSVMQLDAWNWEDALIQEDDAIHLNWPTKPVFRDEPKPEQLKGYKNALESLRATFEAAESYYKEPKPKMNLKLESMKGLFDGSKQLFIHVSKAKEIVRSLDFSKEFGVKNRVLVDAVEVLLVKEYVKENDIPVILNEVHAMPYTADGDVDESYKLPYLLHQEGIRFCLGYSSEVMRTRNLPFLAGTAVAYGLDNEEAVKSITLSTAQILKIDDRLGSIETGKYATLFVSEGDALDMRTNRLTHIFIQGRKVALEAMQQELYQKYKAKYGQN